MRIAGLSGYYMVLLLSLVVFYAAALSHALQLHLSPNV